jgi:hypothetical protein
MAELHSELPVHRHRVDQSPLSHALCHGSDPSAVVVQFRASVFHVVASTLYRLDGCEQIGAATGCLLCSGLLPRERNLHMLIWELIHRNPGIEVPSSVRRIMRFRSITTLCLFGVAALVALKYPMAGLGICICCLIVYLKPDPPGVRRLRSQG